MSAHGRFIWHDLVTTDPDAAQAFYSQITPWSTQSRDDSTDYTIWTLSEAPLGGVSKLSDDLRAGGVGPHWMPYVFVYDVDELIRQAISLGGRVKMGPKELPGVGGWAVISDPQGATIGIFEAADGPTIPAGQPPVGDFSWHELMTNDYKAAAEFYRALFRWETISEFDMGPMGIYHLFGQRGETYGGMFNRGPDMPPPHWLSYIRVDDVKAVAERAAQLGATVRNGPMEVPGGDWIAQLLDPQGAAIAVHEKQSVDRTG